MEIDGEASLRWRALFSPSATAILLAAMTGKPMLEQLDPKNTSTSSGACGCFVG